MHTVRVIGIGAAAVAVVAGGAAYAITHDNGSTAARAAAAAGNNQVVSGPMHIVSVTPASGATGVNGSASVVVTFTAPLAADSPYPELTPSIPGSWTTVGSSQVFTPVTAFAPSSRVTLLIPGGPAGVRSSSGALLTGSITEHFTVGKYSRARLAEVLAQLDYLPMTWSATENAGIRAAAAGPAAGNSTPQGEALPRHPSSSYRSPVTRPRSGACGHPVTRTSSFAARSWHSSRNTA